MLPSDLVVEVLALVLTSTLAALTTLAIAYLRRRFSREQLATAAAIARTVVEATEQLGLVEKLSSSAKYQRALTQARDLARHAGIDLSDAQWRSLIEAAVLQLKAAGAELTR